MAVFDVVIAGGGFAGMAAAAALASQGRRVVVLEANTSVDSRFRGELIHPFGVAGLERLGFLSRVRRVGSPIDGFAVFAGAHHPINLPYAELAGSPTAGIAAGHGALLTCFREHLATLSAVDVRTGARAASLLREGGRIVGVRTAAGEELRAELTLIADGRHSKLRRAAGIDAQARLVSFTATMLVDADDLPNPRHGHVMFGPLGTVLAYPIGSGKARVCIDLPVDIDKGQAAISRAIRDVCVPALPQPFRRALLEALEDQTPEVCANHALSTRTCVLDGTAIIGDAAGCSHPLTASGIMISLNDACILGEELRASGPLGAALRRFQRRRYSFVRPREILSEALYAAFCAKDESQRLIRSGVFRYWRSGPAARAASMALLSGHESRLSAFLLEYARVVGTTARCSIDLESAGLRDSSRVEVLGGLMQVLYTQAERVATETGARLSGVRALLGAQ